MPRPQARPLALDSGCDGQALDMPAHDGPAHDGPAHDGPAEDMNCATPLAILRWLARSGALAIEAHDGIRIVAPRKRSQDRARPAEEAASTPLAPDIWRSIVRRGLVVPHDDTPGWRLSNAGRIAIKRHASARGAPPGATDTSAPSERANERDARPQRSAGRATTAAPVGAASARRSPPNGPVQNDAESPLEWLHRRRDRDGRALMTDAQFAAGERLRADFTFASLMPSVTARWSPVGGSVPGYAPDRELELRDGQLRARERFRAALHAVGPEFADLLVDVCCYLKGLGDIEQRSGWPQRSAKVVLLLALTALARHYGLTASRHPGVSAS